jgi:hypothetical protein
MLESRILGVPSVTTGQALEPLNLASVLAILPTPLLNMCRTTVRALLLIGVSDFKREIEVLCGDVLAEVEREIDRIDVLAGNLPVSEV